MEREEKKIVRVVGHYLLGRLDASGILEIDIPLVKCSYGERCLALGLGKTAVLKVHQGPTSELKEPS